MRLPLDLAFPGRPAVEFGSTRLYEMDCLEWLGRCPERTIHAVVTDPPYGLVEYTEAQQRKLRAGRGGVWIPPSFDGHPRSPLPEVHYAHRQGAPRD